MRIQLFSDTHNEHDIIDDIRDQIECQIDRDVIVIAGDFSSGNDLVPDLIQFADSVECDIIFVPGNHEYYNSSREQIDAALLNIDHPRIHVLIEDTVEIDGVLFIGSTGWFDGSGGHIGLTCRGALNDFSLIKELYTRSVGDTQWGEKSKLFFETELEKVKRENPDKKVVCVSHHFPHRFSIHHAYSGSVLNPCFYNAWEPMIEQYKPDLWLHGHTHMSFDYKDPELDTRIICNPQGYPEIMYRDDKVIDGYENFFGFQPQKIIEI